MKPRAAKIVKTDKRYLTSGKNGGKVFLMDKAFEGLRPYLRMGYNQKLACELAGVNYKAFRKALDNKPEWKAQMLREQELYRMDVVGASREALKATVKRSKNFNEAHKFALEKYDPALKKEGGTNVQVNILNKIQEDIKDFQFDE